MTLFPSSLADISEMARTIAHEIGHLLFNSWFDDHDSRPWNLMRGGSVASSNNVDLTLTSPDRVTLVDAIALAFFQKAIMSTKRGKSPFLRNWVRCNLLGTLALVFLGFSLIGSAQALLVPGEVYWSGRYGTWSGEGGIRSARGPKASIMINIRRDYGPGVSDLTFRIISKRRVFSDWTVLPTLDVSMQNRTIIAVQIPYTVLFMLGIIAGVLQRWLKKRNGRGFPMTQSRNGK
jgi:hypothetical protein